MTTDILSEKLLSLRTMEQKELTSIKNRFGIIGNDPMLNRAIEIAYEVANTDLSVLVTGESGVGKEFIPQIIHTNSARKHAAYIAVNCGAIHEGTIDSELFGHEKGAFTGANDTRKGYFEVADGGTIFLDEVGELPLSTQVRLLRVLQSGEFIKVGSSKVQKCNVRIVAATNVNLGHSISTGKFREDLYYRLNTVPIVMPPLRERVEDINLLFRKFVSDFSEKYKMPSIRLDANAQKALAAYRWPGNIRQLKNVAEQMSVLEKNREISEAILRSYLPQDSPSNLPVRTGTHEQDAGQDFMSEREILYKIFFKLKSDVEKLQEQVKILSGTGAAAYIHESNPVPAEPTVTPAVTNVSNVSIDIDQPISHMYHETGHDSNILDGEYEEITEAQENTAKSIEEMNMELIKKALAKYNGNRKDAARELGISERTLYRKLRKIN